MQNICTKCKCRVCGLMHDCEIIMEKIISMDESQCHTCEPIFSCSEFTRERDTNRHKEWVCDIIKIEERM